MKKTLRMQRKARQQPIYSYSCKDSQGFELCPFPFRVSIDEKLIGAIENKPLSLILR